MISTYIHRVSKTRETKMAKLTKNTQADVAKLVRDFANWREALKDAGQAVIDNDAERARTRGNVADMYAYDVVAMCEELGIDPSKFGSALIDCADDYRRKMGMAAA